MTGNVAEWTADRYDGLYYYKSPERNPDRPTEWRIPDGSWGRLERCVIRDSPHGSGRRRAGETGHEDRVPLRTGSVEVTLWTGSAQRTGEREKGQITFLV
jgi:hypothetical protein